MRSREITVGRHGGLTVSAQPTIVLIDDNESLIRALNTAIESRLKDGEGRVETWVPREQVDIDVRKNFRDRIEGRDTVLVITDDDLSTTFKGLSGTSIVAWCQALALPVGDFSRGVDNLLPKEPNPFELRIPTDAGEAADFIVNAFRGFQHFRRQLEAIAPDDLEHSLAAVLSRLLGRPHLETQFAPYVTRLASANGSLIQMLLKGKADRVKILVYVLGHVMLNAVIKFPGPIMHEAALCAYVGTDSREGSTLAELFKDARYDGPFQMGERLYWAETVDALLDKFGESIADESFDDFGDLNRSIAERAIGKGLATHGCARCGGVKGGFWCPFMLRPVCVREDCSVPSSSWIPQGAHVCRVERDFYDEWAPVLGL